MEPTALQLTWFVLLGVLMAGYAILDGFDLGVGILHLFAHDDHERRVFMSSIGPLWDGNEVWLVVAAGATFAAFPAWYATMFSGFYLALLLILALLVVRVLSFEWREKVDQPRWKTLWAWLNTIASVGVPLLWGIVLTSFLHGVFIVFD